MDIRSVAAHPSHRFDREIPQQVRCRDPQRTADSQDDGQAWHFGSAFEIARVGRGDLGGLRKLFLRPFGLEAQLPQSLSEDFSFDGHVELIFNYR